MAENGVPEASLLQKEQPAHAPFQMDFAPTTPDSSPSLSAAPLVPKPFCSLATTSESSDDDQPPKGKRKGQPRAKGQAVHKGLVDRKGAAKGKHTAVQGKAKVTKCRNETIKGRSRTDRAVPKSNSTAKLSNKQLQPSSSSGSSSPEPSDDQHDRLSKAPSTLPKSSGLFDYAAWATTHILTSEERQAMAKEKCVRVGSMCTGMATEEMVLAALHLALQEHGVPFHHESIFKAENNGRKMAFLRRHFSRGGTHFFKENSALAHLSAKDVDGKVVEQPTVDILMCGIVCKDISQLRSNPLSERASGVSGRSLTSLMDYVSSLRHDKRPRIIILECVQRLGHRRAVDPDSRTGTQYIQEELSKIGYKGKWQNVHPTRFYLPQSRPRVYGIFMKDNMNGVNRHPEEVARVFELLARLQVPAHAHESLSKVLDRLGTLKSPASPSKGRGSIKTGTVKAPKQVDKWRQRHQAWLRAKNLKDVDLQGKEEFLRIVGSTLVPREQDALWLRLAHLRKTKRVNWQDQTLIATVGASVHFMSVRSDQFPCVCPQMTYAILREKQVKLADGFTLLAMQGIQPQEVHHFKLASESDCLLRDFAGNAFTANILCAHLMAGLVVL